MKNSKERTWQNNSVGRVRLPAGFGCIRYLGSGRRRPYAAYPPKPPGGRQYPAALCYAPDWFTAFAVLVSWHAGVYYDGIENKLGSAVPGNESRTPAVFRREAGAKEVRPTLREVYQEYCIWKFGPNAARKLSASARRGAESGMRRLRPFHDMPMDDIPLDALQEHINRIEASRTTVNRVVALIRQLYRFALPRDLCAKDLSAAIVMPDTPPETHHQDFTDDELAVLWAHRKDPVVRMVLIMCYSGYRVSAWLSMETDPERGYFRGGVKTKTGKGRLVPIHSAILPLVRETLSEGPYLCGKDITRFCHVMTEKMEAIGIDGGGRHHTPHSCRHTFSRLCESYGVREADRKRMLGHSFGNDITNGTYGHRSLEELRQEIEKIRV